MAVTELLAAQRPDAAEEQPQAIILNVEAIQPLAGFTGLLPLLLPEAPHMEKMLEGIIGLPDFFAEAFRQAGRIVHRSHVEKGVQLLLRQPRHIIQAKRERRAGNAGRRSS